MTRWHCCTRPKAEGNSASGHPQHRGCDNFDCCTERYEIVILLPSSELTKGSKKCDADANTVRLRRKTMADGLFKLPITVLFMVRKIQCWYNNICLYQNYQLLLLETVKLDAA